MTSAQHTPGPWSAFYKQKYDEWHVSLPVEGSGMRLALCPDGIQSERREADAHLIASAPDLLAALKAISATDEFGLLSLSGQKVREIAHAAIAKAEGQS